MLMPTPQALRRFGQGGSMTLHPNPRLYKYRWRVYTAECELEGEDFLTSAQRLCTFDCAERVAELKLAHVPFLLYPLRQPRRHVGMPFEPTHARWRFAEWAPALEDDRDPEWNQHR